jgi:hypothetical protein
MGTADRVRKAFRVHQVVEALDKGVVQDRIDEPVSSPPPPESPDTPFSSPSSNSNPPGPNGSYYGHFGPLSQYSAFNGPSGYPQQALRYGQGAQPPFNNHYDQFHTNSQQYLQQDQSIYQHPPIAQESFQSFHSGQSSLDHQPSTYSNHAQGINGSGHTSQAQYSTSSQYNRDNGGPSYTAQTHGSPASDAQSMFTPPPAQNNTRAFSPEFAQPSRSHTTPNMNYGYMPSVLHCGHYSNCWNQ